MFRNTKKNSSPIMTHVLQLENSKMFNYNALLSKDYLLIQKRKIKLANLKINSLNDLI